jgi:hypothetical protein
LRSSLSGRDQGSGDQIDSAIRSRNLLFAVLGAVLVIVGIVVALYFGFHNHASTPAKTSSAIVRHFNENTKTF